MFFFLETDSFDRESRSTGDVIRSGQFAETTEKRNVAPIRRPYRGIQIKEDTYAALSVRGPDGSPIVLSSSSDTQPEESGQGKVNDYSDFILQRVEDQRMEKNQIVETFGDSYVYFFGERPRSITFSGMLLNTDDFNWRAQFWHNYDNYFRGTKLVQLNARVYLAFDTIVIEGYPLTASAVDDADNPYTIPFQMTMLVTNYHEYSSIGETRFPGALHESIDVLNQALEKRRSRFVDSTAAVRAANIASRGPASGFLATMRAGIKGYNSLVGVIGGFLETGANIIGGRVVRMPRGVAGYLEATKDAEWGAGSVKSTSSYEFNRISGEIASRSLDSHKVPPTIRIASGSRFTPSWISEVTGQSVGVIWENYDEYPKRNQEPTLESLLSGRTGAAKAYRDLVAKRVAEAKEKDATLVNMNLLADSGGVVGDIAQVVSFARDSFSMVATAASFIGDPLGTATAALGLRPADLPTIGVAALRGLAWPVGEFVGTGAGRSLAAYANTRRFDASVQSFLTHGEADFGEAFRGAGFIKDKDNNVEFEPVYQRKDYSEFLAQSPTIEELVARRRALAEAHGDVDSPSSEDSPTPESVESIYTLQGGVYDVSISEAQRAESVSAAYANVTTAPEEEDTSGIRENVSKAPVRLRYKKDTTRILPAV